MNNMKSIQDYIDIGSSAVLKAAEIVLSSTDSLRATLSVEESGREVKLRADGLLNETIIEELKDSHINILSEETGVSYHSHEEEFEWIIDPLDGSANFSRGITLCGISLALCQKGYPVAGILYDLNTQTLIVGCKEKGARSNGQLIQTASTSELNQAILCTGFPARASFRKQDLEKTILQIQKFQKIRMLGSAVQSLIYLARGLTDAYIEKDIMIWDVAAGLAIVEAAGGKWHWEQGSKRHSRNVFASGPNLFHAMKSLQLFT